MADYLTTTEVKTYLRKTTSTDDALLVTFITAACDVIESIAGRVYRSTAFTEYHRGGRDCIVLNNAPVLSVTSVTDQGGLVDAGDYIVHAATGLIRRKQGQVFTGGYDEVVIVGTAGVAEVPQIVKHATLEQLRHLWDTQRGIARPVQGDEYVDSATGYTVPNRVRELVELIAAPGGMG